MAVYERRNVRYNEPSFSSSLLDAIYRSIDEVEDFHLHRKKNNATADEDAESLRRAIMIEEWIDNYSSATTTSTPRHLPSNSGSSTDSSAFSSSTETESSVSKSTPRPKNGQTPVKLPESKTRRQGKFASTKSRAQKIYGDLKKVKEPISPGGKIANFLNSIFSPRNLKASQAGPEEWGGPVIKSRSVNGKSVNVTKMSSVIKSRSLNDTKTTRSCLSRNQFSRGSSSNNNSNKSKRSVRFCPVSVIVDEDCQPCGHKTIYSNEYPISSSGAAIGSQYIKKNIDSLRNCEGINTRRHELRDYYYYYNNQKKEINDFDDMSCASSDLFELENIGRAGVGSYEEDQLPVYGSTSFKMNTKVIW